MRNSVQGKAYWLQTNIQTNIWKESKNDDCITYFNAVQTAKMEVRFQLLRFVN